MKKLLIIQQDEAYFLFETIQVIEKNPQTFKDYELTLLVNEKALEAVYNNTFPVIKGLTTDVHKVVSQTFDVSVNFSLSEDSWDLHGKTTSHRKLGMYTSEGQLWVDDLWSSLLLTLKSKAPFLTYHLQDIYKNILGIKSFNKRLTQQTTISQFAYSMASPALFSPNEQESFINDLARNYPTLPIKDLSEIDLISNISQTLYIGPATIEALKFCEAGGKGIFISSAFKGFNLLPYGSSHLFVSSRGNSFESKNLMSIVQGELSGKTFKSSTYSLYRTDNETVFGAYLESLNSSDDNYPFYQSYVVLWNFLLNLLDTDLEITRCSPSQTDLLDSQSKILSKIIRLHDYAMSAIDTIYHESKEPSLDHGTIDKNLKQLLEIEEVMDQMAATHPLLRPVLDFYRIRRGQNRGTTFQEQSQVSFLAYAEEHQALEALHELFSVTLKKNEVNI